MTSTRKYANLPDIDISARDVFETPDLTDDVSTLPTTLSVTSEDEEEKEDLLRTGLKPSAARNVFANAIVDASDVDFSDRVSSKRKSYKVSTKRRRDRTSNNESDFYEDDDEDNSDAEESMASRLARLRREAEELRMLIEANRQNVGEDGLKVEEEDGHEQEDEEEGWERLTEVLDELSTARGQGTAEEAGMARRLANSLKVAPKALDKVEGTPSNETNGTMTTAHYSISYSPAFKKTYTLSKVADFDNRITLLERLLGITPTATSLSSTTAVIPAIEAMTKHLTLLTSSTPNVLDAASRRVKVLIAEAEKLTETRKAASRAIIEDELGAVHTIPGDPESEAKINALYGTLATIESYSPLLPAVLDRLRSLRSIHAESARSVKALEDVERKQEEMRWEIEKWKEALEKVEVNVVENGKVIEGNMDQMNVLVKDLEKRMRQLS